MKRKNKTHNFYLYIIEYKAYILFFLRLSRFFKKIV